jgi:UDP-N-acetylglucosamine 2-epimerase (non-hydrolysing)
VLQNLKLEPGNYALLTLHRAANVDDRESFVEILEGLRDLARSHRIIFPAHPRTQKQIAEHRLDRYFSSEGAGIQLLPPQGYLDFLCLMKHARIVVTDSGGIQEETTALGVPCVTVRENTERPVTVEIGTNILAGTKRGPIQQAIQQQLAFSGSCSLPKKWDGLAGTRIVQILADLLILHSSAVSAPETAVASAQKNA